MADNRKAKKRARQRLVLANITRQEIVLRFIRLVDELRALADALGDARRTGAFTGPEANAGASALTACAIDLQEARPPLELPSALLFGEDAAHAGA